MPGRPRVDAILLMMSPRPRESALQQTFYSENRSNRGFIFGPALSSLVPRNMNFTVEGSYNAEMKSPEFTGRSRGQCIRLLLAHDRNTDRHTLIYSYGLTSSSRCNPGTVNLLFWSNLEHPDAQVHHFTTQSIHGEAKTQISPQITTTRSRWNCVASEWYCSFSSCCAVNGSDNRVGSGSNPGNRWEYDCGCAGQHLR